MFAFFVSWQTLGTFFRCLQDLAEPPLSAVSSIVFNDERNSRGERRISKKKGLNTGHLEGTVEGGGLEILHKNFSPINFGKAFLKLKICFTENNSLGSLPCQTLPASCFKRRLQPTDLHFVYLPAVFHQFSKHFFGKNPRCSMPNS